MSGVFYDRGLGMNIGGRRSIALLALLAGVGGVIFFGDSRRWTWPQVIPLCLATIFGVIPAINTRFARMLELIRDPSPRARVWIGCAIALAAFLCLLLPPVFEGRALFPRSHDEQMHMVQVQTLAHGRLWMPAHPLGDFFETFFVLARPVYAACYFPGTSLLFVPMVWLKLPYALLPAIYGSAAVAMFYMVLTEVIDGAAGIAGTILMLSCNMFRELAQGVMSHNTMLLLGILMIWAWLRWLRQSTRGRAFMLGSLVGLAAITRPVEAICYFAAITIFSWAKLSSLAGREKRATLLALFAGAMPFIGLQLIFNVGVTGHLLETPYQYYLEANQPHSSYGFYPPDDDVWPQSELLQKSLYYDQFIRPAIRAHQPHQLISTWLRRRLPLLFEIVLAHPILIALLPVGLMGLSDRRRRAIWAIFPLLIIAYVPFMFFLSHYLVIWLVPLIFSVVLAERVLRESWPKHAAMISTLFFLLVIAASISALPPINPTATRGYNTPLLDDVHTTLAALPREPAVVLFRYDPRLGYNEEPVFTTDAPYPDDALIVRAHDLGPRNSELAKYYDARQPERKFYLYDPSTRSLKPLGTAREMAQRSTTQPIAK